MKDMANVKWQMANGGATGSAQLPFAIFHLPFAIFHLPLPEAP